MVGPASDQYSLGVVLYELLTGQRPFEGPPHSVITQVVSQEPPAPRSHDAAIPKDLETICLKAMAKGPQDRYGSCDQLARDLNRWLDDEPITVKTAILWCVRNEDTERVIRNIEPMMEGIVASGTADRSYGIHVARLAGLPDVAIARAEQVLAKLEQGEQSGHAAQVLTELAEDLPLFAALKAAPRGAAAPVPTMSPEEAALIEAVKALDPDSLPPRAALEELYRLRALLKGG